MKRQIPRGVTVCECMLPSFLSPISFAEEHGRDQERRYIEKRASSPGSGNLSSSALVSAKSLDNSSSSSNSFD